MKILSIGRDKSNQIMLNDNFVSRKHAELIIDNNRSIMIKDLGSSNGTFVNGHRIDQAYLKAGDTVTCANEFLNWQQYINESVPNKIIIETTQPDPLPSQPQPSNQFRGFNKIFSIEKFKSNRIGSGTFALITGLALIIMSQTLDFTKTRTYDLYDTNKSMGLPDAFNNHMLDTDTYVDTKKKNNMLYSGLVILIVGGLLLESGLNAKNKHINTQV